MTTRTNGFIRALPWVFLCFATAYLLALSRLPYPLSWVVKSVPIFCLAILVWHHIPGKKGTLLCLGFLLSGFGDIFLEFRSPNFFILGMGAFTLAHLSYIRVFLMNGLTLNIGRMIAMGGLLLYSISFGIFLFPNLGAMMLPIYLYLGVISIMGISACLGKFNHPWVILGAFLFVISDSLIAYTMFVSPIYLSAFLIMTTYYLAQALLARGGFLNKETVLGNG